MDPREQEFDIREYVTILSRRRWHVILAFLTVLVSTGLYTLAQTPIYEAETRLLISKPRTNPSSGPGTAGAVAIAEPYDIETEMERLKSPGLVRDAQQKLQAEVRGAPVTERVVRQIGKTNIIAVVVAPSSR